jgi:hypothetical protein
VRTKIDARDTDKNNQDDEGNNNNATEGLRDKLPGEIGE